MPPREDLVIGGRHMGVGADHEAGAAVAEKSDALLLAGRLAVEIDHDGIGGLAQRAGLELAVDHALKGSSSGSMKTRPMALMTSARLPFLVSISGGAAARRVARKIQPDGSGAARASMNTSASF